MQNRPNLESCILLSNLEVNKAVARELELKLIPTNIRIYYALMNLSKRFAPFKFNATNWPRGEVLCELESLHINYYRRWNQQRRKKMPSKISQNWMTHWIRSIRLGRFLCIWWTREKVWKFFSFVIFLRFLPFYRLSGPFERINIFQHIN